MFNASFATANMFKDIVDGIKDLMEDVMFDCSPDALEIQSMDRCHVAMVWLQLRPKAFEHFKCDRNISMGIHMASLDQILKCFNKADTLTLKKEVNSDYVKLASRCLKTFMTSNYNLRLLNLDIDRLCIEEHTYKCKINIDSSNFGNIVKNLAKIGDRICITCTKEFIQFSTNGDLTTATVKLDKTTSPETEAAVTIELDEPVELAFSGKYLAMFAKASRLSDRVQLLFANDRPMIVNYAIGHHGHLKYYLAPKIGDEEPNDDEHTNNDE